MTVDRTPSQHNLADSRVPCAFTFLVADVKDDAFLPSPLRRDLHIQANARDPAFRSLAFTSSTRKEACKMTDYAVTCATRDTQGDILTIGGAWGALDKNTAIYCIQFQLHSFHVPLTDGSVAQIEVVNGSTGPYLRTNWDGTTKNNLDDLRPC